MKKTPLITLLLLLTLFSCKTQEEIAQEKKISTMSVQMQQNLKLNAEATSKLQETQDQMLQFQGQLEEYTKAKDEKIATLDQKILKLEEQNVESTKQITDLNAKVVEQDKFIKEVLELLKKKNKPKQRKYKSKYDEGMALYGQGKYQQSRVILEGLYKSKSLKGKKRARVTHNLGMISYIQKRNNDAITYFSTLYTTMPKSAYNGNGLVYLSRTFKRQGKNDQAIVTLEEMISTYPKSRHVKTAKTLLAKYKK